MIIEFYKTESEQNRLKKVLTDKLTIEGKFKTEVNILNPIISFSNSSPLTEYNYLFIPELNRYYYVDRVEISQTQIYTIYLSIDVLMTYKEQIKNLKVILKQSTANPYFNEFTDSHDVRTESERKDFKNEFNELGANILIAINGADRV